MIWKTRKHKIYGDGSYQLYEPQEDIDLKKANFRFKKSYALLFALIFIAARIAIGA